MSVDATVDFDAVRELKSGASLFREADFFEHRFEKALPTETGFDRHNQEEIDLIQERLKSLKGGSGAKG